MKTLYAEVGCFIFLILVFGSNGCNPNSGGTSSSLSNAATDAGSTAQNAQQDASYTFSRMNAIRSAKSYLQMRGFSKAGLIKQLSSQYGEGFSEEDAVFAVDHIDVDWNEQAYRAAESYLQMKGFSHAGLVQQLESKSGEDFTHAQAEYGVKKSGL